MQVSFSSRPLVLNKRSGVAFFSCPSKHGNAFLMLRRVDPNRKESAYTGKSHAPERVATWE